MTGTPKRKGEKASAASSDMSCRKLQLKGEVKAGERWSAAIAQGWTFRVLPISPSGHGYTGWDLVVDPPIDESYPDALLLGTPPYGSLTEREVGTTFGLRAQDAIAWEPRHFHFLNSVKNIHRARDLYRQVLVTPSARDATSELLGIVGPDSGNLSSGQFRIVDAHLKTGAADPASYASQWALHLQQVPHTVIQPEAGSSVTPRGELQWVSFEVTLWIPQSWLAANSVPSSCAQ